MQVQVGVDAGAVVDLAAELKEATERWGASFLTAPLAHPRHRRDARGSCVDAWTRSDLVLNSTQWGQQVVGKLSAWVVPRLDSCHVEIRRKAEAAFQQELAWAAHLTLAAVLAPPPPPGGVNYARCVSGVLHATQHMQIWVTVPLSAPPLSDAAPTGEGAAGAGPDEAATGGDGGGGGEGGGEGAWRSWHRLRSLAEHHPNLGVALELGLDLPDEAAQLDRWCVTPMHASATCHRCAQVPRVTDAHQRHVSAQVRRADQGRDHPIGDIPHEQEGLPDPLAPPPGETTTATTIPKPQQQQPQRHTQSDSGAGIAAAPNDASPRARTLRSVPRIKQQHHRRYSSASRATGRGSSCADATTTTRRASAPTWRIYSTCCRSRARLPRPSASKGRTTTIYRRVESV